MINGEFLAYPLIFIIFIVLSMKLWEKTKELKEKNLRLIQFYLDRKFIYNVLINGLSLKHRELLSSEIINKIKEYFQLEEIKIIGYSSLDQNENLAFLFKEKLKSVINSHYNKKESNLKNFPLILDSVKIANNTYRLYIYFPHEKINRKNQEIIIYVRTKFDFEDLTNDEILTLDTSIHILKICSFLSV